MNFSSSIYYAYINIIPQRYCYCIIIKTQCIFSKTSTHENKWKTWQKGI